ncbi:hypothetical protein SK128_024151, partial [Halocaridina rubra]
LLQHRVYLGIREDRWISGRSLSETEEWGIGEPSSNVMAENCAMTMSSTWKIHDIPCPYTEYFICERKLWLEQ